jgi:DnaJ-class molecular chaperone
MQLKNYYNILGIHYTATDNEIKKAFRQNALYWHPDKNKSLNANEKFIEIYEAYNILIDPKKRDVYNDLLNQQLNNSNNSIQIKNHTDNREKYENWVYTERENAKKVTLKSIDDLLTESFHFLDKYRLILLMLFLILSLVFVLIIGNKN